MRLLFVILIECCVCFLGTASRQWYVSNTGNDTSGCGGVHKPCATLRYTIPQTHQNDVVLMNAKSGVFKNESDTVHMNINHSLFIRSYSDDAVIIQCSRFKSSLFNITGSQGGNNTLASTVTVQIDNIVIRNCQNQDIGNPVILVENSKLDIRDSSFMNNGLLVHHSQLRANGCQHLEFSAKNVTFKHNTLSKPLEPGIAIGGCDSIIVRITTATLISTPVSVIGERNLTFFMEDVVIDGKSTSCSTLDITLSDVYNQHTLTDCVIKNHQMAAQSAMLISANKMTQMTPILNMNNVTFVNNTHTGTEGGALTVIARFQKSKTIPIYLTLDKCSFINNTADFDGGAIYMRGTATIKINQCIFIGNKGLNGGAVRVINSEHINLTNTLFTRNQAADTKFPDHLASAGAVYITGGSLYMTNVTMQQNTGTFAATELFADYIHRLTIIQSQFMNDFAESGISDILSLVKVQVIDSDSYVQLSQNTFLGNSVGQNALLDVQGLTNADQNIFFCRAGQNLRSVQSSTLPTTQVVYWCENCPANTYMSDMSGGLETALCQVCPVHAQCRGGQLYTQPNFWAHHTDDHVELLLCPYNYCCADNHCTMEENCVNHRNGTLCAQCSLGFMYDVVSESCVEESYCNTTINSSGTIVALIGFSSLYLLFFTLTLFAGVWLWTLKLHGCWCNRSASSPEDDITLINSVEDESDEDSEEEQTCVLRTYTPDNERSLNICPDQPNDVVVHAMPMPMPDPLYQVYVDAVVRTTFLFYQWLALIFHPHVGVHERADQFAAGVMDFFNARLIYSSFSYLCPYENLTYTGQIILDLCCYYLQYVVLVLIFVTFRLLVKFIPGQTPVAEGNRRDLINVLASGAFLNVAILTYVPLSACLANSLTCVTVSNITTIYLDTNVECDTTLNLITTVYFYGFISHFFLTIWIGAYLLKEAKISSGNFVFCCLLPPTIWFFLVASYFYHWSDQSLELNISAKRILQLVKPSECIADSNKDKASINARIVPESANCVVRLGKFIAINYVSIELFLSLLLVIVSCFLLYYINIRALLLEMICVLHLCLCVLRLRCGPFFPAALSIIASCLTISFASMNLYTSIFYSMGEIAINSDATLTSIFDNVYLVVIILVVSLLIICTMVLLSVPAVQILRWLVNKTCTRRQ